MSHSPAGNVAFSGLQLNNTLGAMFVGIFIAASKDGIFLQGLIVFLGILDVLQSIFSVVGEYHYVIDNFTNPQALLLISWPFPVFLIVTVVIDFCVRCTFIYRFWILSNMHLITIFLMIVNFIVIAFSLVIGVKYAQIRYFLEMAEVKWELITQLSLITFIDTVVAVFLCTLLWRSKTRVASKHIVSQINVLMAYTLHTGAFTSLISIGVIVTLIYAAVYVVLPKGEFLRSLNGREWMRATSDHSVGYNSIHLSDVTPSDRAFARTILTGGSSDIQAKLRWFSYSSMTALGHYKHSRRFNGSNFAGGIWGR
ncbi:hypothetical protein C8Q75DRAFT_733401 [Abortiporus biennis]|nr:hypothetical protein C8Q75DRAFT_733401 [Abortiporus biennis]